MSIHLLSQYPGLTPWMTKDCQYASTQKPFSGDVQVKLVVDWFKKCVKSSVGLDVIIERQVKENHGLSKIAPKVTYQMVIVLLKHDANYIGRNTLKGPLQI